MTMTNLSTRQTLTDLAAHLREVYGRDAASLVELWRDQHFPENTVTKHRWEYLSRFEDGVWLDRRCLRCSTVDQYGVMEPGGKKVAHFVLPDGSLVQKDPNPMPPCRPSNLPSVSIEGAHQ